MIYMFLSNNPSSGDINSSNLSCSLQISSRTQFAKIENKKVIAENQCEKHKKSSLVDLASNFFVLCTNMKVYIYNYS